MPRPSRVLSIVLAIAGTAAAGVTLVMLFAARGQAPPESRLPLVFAAVELLGVGVVLAAAWSALFRHLASAACLGALAVALCLPIWAGFPPFTPSSRAWMDATVPLAIPAAAAAMAWLRVSSRRSPALAASAASATLSALTLGLGRNPALEHECVRTCLSVPVALEAGVSTDAALSFAAAFAAIAAALGASAVTLNATTLSRGERLTATTVLISSGLCALAPRIEATTATWVALVPYLLGLVTSSVVLIVLARQRRARGWLRANLDALRSSEAGAIAIGGQRASVLFAVPQTDGAPPSWVDAHGNLANETIHADHVWTLTDEGHPVVRILQAPSSGALSDLREAITPAARLRLANARLTALSLSRVRELRASQRRIVETTDAESHRIERDLHDGAQQRLVSAALYIEIARRADASADLTAAADAVRTATGGLRRIVEGAFPALLLTEGLDAALDELAAQCDIALVVDGSAGSLSPDASCAAYALVTAAVETAHNQGWDALHVDLAARDRELSVTVDAARKATARTPVEGASLADAEDRIGALGGRLRRFSDSEIWGAEAVIPCAS